MQQTANYDKNMEHRMHIAFLFSYAVENSSYRVADTAKHKEHYAAFAYRFNENWNYRGDYPAYRKVQDH